MIRKLVLVALALACLSIIGLTGCSKKDAQNVQKEPHKAEKADSKDTIKPFGDIEWDDTLATIVGKLKQLGVEELKLNGDDALKMTAVEIESLPLQGIRDPYSGGIDEGISHGVIGEFNINGQQYFSRNQVTKLEGKPIVVEGVPFKISVELESSSGFVLKNIDKLQHLAWNDKKRGPVLLVCPIRMVGLYLNCMLPSGEMSDEQYAAVLKIIDKKYGKFADGEKKAGERGGPGNIGTYISNTKEYKDSLGNVLSLQKRGIYYQLSPKVVGEEQKLYAAHLNEIEQGKFKGKSDQGGKL